MKSHMDEWSSKLGSVQLYERNDLCIALFVYDGDVSRWVDLTYHFFAIGISERTEKECSSFVTSNGIELIVSTGDLLIGKVLKVDLV